MGDPRRSNDITNAGAEDVFNRNQPKTKDLSSEHAIRINQPKAAIQGSHGSRVAAPGLLSEGSGKYYIIRFGFLSVALYSLGVVASHFWMQAIFSQAFFIGLAVCSISSFFSFAITEYGFDLPKDMFVAVALGSAVFRMFAIPIIFAIGTALLKLHVAGLVTGLFAGYVSHLVLEIAYVHTKGLNRRH